MVICLKAHNNLALGKLPPRMFTDCLYLVPKKERSRQTQLFLDESFLTIPLLIKLFARGLKAVFFKVTPFIRKLNDDELPSASCTLINLHPSCFRGNSRGRWWFVSVSVAPLQSYASLFVLHGTVPFQWVLWKMLAVILWTAEYLHFSWLSVPEQRSVGWGSFASVQLI